MYSNDTRELERQLQKLKENKEFNDIFNSIETYLNTENIRKSLEIIYELIKDNYCHIFQNVDITNDSKLNKEHFELTDTDWTSVYNDLNAEIKLRHIHLKDYSCTGDGLDNSRVIQKAKIGR